MAVDAEGGSTGAADFYVTGLLEGRGVLWFFAVPGEAAEAEAEAEVQGLLRPPPRPDSILAEIRIPFTISPSKPSPTLSAILTSNDPRLEQSASLSTVRLLIALCAAPRVASGVSGEEAFVQVARELSAVLQLNVAAGGGIMGGGEGLEAAAVEAGCGGGGAGAAGDALAALVAALEAADEEGGGEGEGEGGWTPLGGLGAAAAAAPQQQQHSGSGWGVMWLGHLARHSYFCGPGGSGQGAPAHSAVAEDYASWAFALKDLQR